MLGVVIYWIGAAADIWTTVAGLKRGARELNPIARFVLGEVDNPWIALVVLKLLAFIVLGYVAGSPGLAAAGVVYLIAAAGNHYRIWGTVLEAVRGLWSWIVEKVRR